MSRTRIILHLDLDAFFCAVEEHRDASLVGKAFAVGGKPQHRGVVASCSYAARQYGIRSAMPMSQAVRRCADLVIVPPRHDAYSAASKQVMARLETLTPFVEQISIDEAFLDMTGIPGTGRSLAENLQQVINTELQFPCSIGVATNKLVAKIANNIGKAAARTGSPPNAITVIEPGQEATFLAPLPIRELWGVGPKTAEKLADLGLQTIGDIAAWPEKDLAKRFGKIGGELALRARGIDDRAVEPEHEAKSISKETTFVRDVKDHDALLHTLRGLCEGVGWRLRQSELTGTTVKLKIRWPDFTTLTRQLTIAQGVDQDSEIYDAACALFYETWRRGRAVRLIGVGVSGLKQGTRQLELWETEESKQGRQLQSVLDDLRDRFGDDAVKRGTDVKARHKHRPRQQRKHRSDD